MSRSMKGGLWGRRKRALARLEIALAKTPKEQESKIARMQQEIKTLKERIAINTSKK